MIWEHTQHFPRNGLVRVGSLEEFVCFAPVCVFHSVTPEALVMTVHIKINQTLLGLCGSVLNMKKWISSKCPN